MIIKVIATKPKPRGVERYARHLASYMVDGHRQRLRPDAIGMDYGLTLSAYMTGGGRDREPPPERVLFRGALIAGVAQEWDAAVQETERRLTRRSRKIKKPVRHCVLSCPADEILSENQCSDAVVTMADELGCADAVILWAAHVDTDNFHLHAMIVTVDPQTGSALPFGQEADGRAGYKEAMQRAVARIEHAHMLQPETGARYEMQGGVPIRKPPLPSQPTIRRRSPLRPEIREWEEASGFVSLTRYAQETAGPILDNASSWSQLHDDLAKHGLGIKPVINGGVVHAGEEQVKLSNVDRRHSWKKLEARLGAFEPNPDIEPAPYTPRMLNAEKAERWLRRSQQMSELSGKVSDRVAALLAAREAAVATIRADVAAHRADIAAFDGDPRLRRDVSGAWARLATSATDAIRVAFDARIAAVRSLRLAAAHSNELDMVDMDAIAVTEIAFTSAWYGSEPMKPSIALNGFESERDGDIVRYWSREDTDRRGQPAFIDVGAIIWVNDRSDEATEAAITLAHERFGGAAVFGDAAYISQCHRVARRLGVEIETITVQEAMRRADRRLRSQSTRRRALAMHLADRRKAGDDLRTWAMAYRRAAPDERSMTMHDDRSPLSDVPHHTTIIGITPDAPSRRHAEQTIISKTVTKAWLSSRGSPGRGGIE